MGLTGAGGAMISIPLFIGQLDASLKDATVLSLIAVILGTSVNLIGQLSAVNKKIVLMLSLAGMLANYFSLPLKEMVNEFLISGLLTVISAYSIWSVWKTNPPKAKLSQESFIIPKAIMAGLFLGLITTLTGLGGGVVLVPILMNFFGRNYEEALPTSLGTIFLIALTSFILQSKTALELVSLTQVAYLGVGALIAFFLLKGILKLLNEITIQISRKIVFTLVNVYAAFSVIINSK